MNINDFFTEIKTTYFLTLLFPVLYAETHYRFKYFFSYLKKNEPELIIDIPSRVVRGTAIPVLLIIKDADKYPVEIDSIQIFEKKQLLQRFHIQKQIDQSYCDIMNEMHTSELEDGIHELSIQVHYKIGNKQMFCISDNHRGTSHKPLLVQVSNESLPHIEPCLYGETHCHSNYTSDQVEFGASLSATAILAKSQEIDFFCVTDHSYDMDDLEDNYLLNDPDLKKWQKFRSEVQENNKNEDNILIIPGEEVTVRNSQGKNIHLLVYNSDEFFPGSGDSGEKWFRNHSELSITDITKESRKDVFYFAAHPAETPPLLQRLFINRGEWESKDCRATGLHGLQFINGGEDRFKLKGRQLWIDQLLADYRLTGLAGNDAHGNFSRFRQVGFPFFTMREHDLHLFGKWRTGVYMEGKNRTKKNVLCQMGNGNCFLTNGPALQMNVLSENSWYPMGSSCTSPSLLRLEAVSTSEFSALEHIEIILGDPIRGVEKSLYLKKFEKETFQNSNEFTLEEIPVKGYLRSEIKTINGYEAFSNPIWFD